MPAKNARAKILKAGTVEIDVMRSGMRQKVEFKVVREDIPIGKVPYLKTDKIINMDELIRVAAELGLPIISPIGKVFPPGKKAVDFLKL